MLGLFLKKIQLHSNEYVHSQNFQWTKKVHYSILASILEDLNKINN